MQPETERQLIDRVLAHARDGGTDMVAHMQRSPVARYLDSDRVEREQRLLYRRLPRVVGHASEVAAPGDFITRDGLLLVRGRDEVLRGFHNVCRHRGTQLVGEPCGNRKAFACPYHAWTYGLDGALASVTHREGFVGLRPEQRGLAPVHVSERFGLVWVQLEGPARDVDDFVGAALCDDLEAFGFAGHTAYRPQQQDRNMSWKLQLDIFLEGYHVHFAHRKTIAPMFFDNVNLFDHFAPHIRVVLPKRSIQSLRDQPRSTWSLREHANVLYLVFPNTLILVMPDHASMFHIYPLAMDRCRIQACMLVPEAPTTGDASSYWDRNLAILHEAIAEDFALGEGIQRGLASGANDDLLFGRFEQSLTWFHHDVERITAELEDAR